MENNIDNIINDIDDSENITFEEIGFYDPSKVKKCYFYKCKSYIKEQKARIIIERNATSILCIETDLSNDPNDLESYYKNYDYITNGFITTGSIISNNIKLDKLNFNDSGSLDFRQLQQPVLDINLPLFFLINNIYVVSFYDLNTHELNYDDIFLVEETINDNPLMLTKYNIEQVPVNRIRLIPLSSYNASRINSISLNKIKPISLNNIKIDHDTDYLFSINFEIILLSNMQFFIKEDDGIIESIKSCQCDIFKYTDDLDYTIGKFPVKLSINNVNDSLQFDNEWIKFVLPWDIAKQFLVQQDLEKLLVIKEIPKIKTYYTNIKFIKTNIKSDIGIAPDTQVAPETHQGKQEIETYYDNTKGIDLSYNISGRIMFFDNILPSTTTMYPNGTMFWALNNSILKLDESKTSTILTENGQEIIIDNYDIALEQPIYFDLNVLVDNISHQTEFNEQPLANLSLDTAGFDGTLSSPPENTIELYNVPDKTLYPDLPEFRQTFSNSSGESTLTVRFKLNSRIYQNFYTEKDATNDKFIFVKLLKEMLKDTVNYRLGLPDAKYDSDGNPQNQMAKLKSQFQIQGVNPLETISNKISNFLMINPWATQVEEWDYLIKSISMLSQYIYSIYSLNTGVKAEEEITLPYYFKLSSSAQKIGNDNDYIYDYTSLQVSLVSKYFRFDELNDYPFDNSTFATFPSLNSKLTLSNNTLKVIFPFLNSSIIENQTITDPQKYDILNEDFQKYILYFILTISKKRTNIDIFNKYMNSIFTTNYNFPKIEQDYKKLSCLDNSDFFSDDKTIIGDLPFNGHFDDEQNSDILISNNKTILLTEIISEEPIISDNKTINIIKE